MAEAVLSEESADRKEADALINAYQATSPTGLANVLDDSYLALPPFILLRVGEALRNRKFKKFAILAMTPDEFLEVGLQEWTMDDMLDFWQILKRGILEEPIRMFGVEFPLSDVTIITKDGVVLYARHMVLSRASRKLGESIHLTDEGKVLILPNDSNGVREILYLLHNSSMPAYDTTYSWEQRMYLHEFADEYEVPRLKELLAIEHLSLDFSRTRGPDDVVVIGKSERLDLDEKERKFLLYADYDALCRASPQFSKQIYIHEGRKCIDFYQDRMFSLLALKVIHHENCTAAEFDLPAEVLGRLHRYAMALGMVRVVHLIEMRLRLKPGCEELAMLVRNTAESRSIQTESLKIALIETMPIAELTKYLDLYGRNFNKGLKNFTTVMTEACQRRLNNEDIYYDLKAMQQEMTERKEYKSPAYRNHISRRDAFSTARF